MSNYDAILAEAESNRLRAGDLARSDDTLGGTRGGFPSFPIGTDSFLVSPVKSLRSPVKSLRSPTATHRTPRGSVSRNSLSNGGSGALASLRDVFTEFANFGVRGDERSDTMDGAKFAKFCRETRLQDGKTLDSQSVDIIFSKVKPRGERRITFEEFKDAVAMVGEMRGERFRDISERVASVGGPRARGTTRAEYVKFADPSNFTGAYAANLGFEIKPRKSADLGWKNKILVPSVDADMKRVFTEFCAFGHGNPCSMENKTFVKLLRDCGLIDGDGTCITNFHQTSADLIFAKVKPKGERVICVEDFVLCVLLVAEEIGEPYETVADSVRNCRPPSNNGGTIAEYNKFHDDKELYTGCYAAHFGVEKTPRQRPEWREEHIQGGKRAPPDVPGLKAMFNAFCTFGGGAPGAMDNVKWVKCVRDSGLLGLRVSQTDADLVFTRVKTKGGRKISYLEFRWALCLLAESAGASYDTVCDTVLAGGPISTGTRAEYSKFHDDQSTYTGAYAVLHHVPEELRLKSLRFCKPNWKEGRVRPSDSELPGLKQRYTQYTSFAAGNGVDMNTKVWAKMVKETLVGSRFTSTSADIVFAKVAEGGKVLGYKDFLWMLALVAEERGETFEQVAQKIVQHAPESSGTVGEYVPWHDDKSTFTGAHAARFGLEQRITDRKGWKHTRVKPKSIDGVENVFDAYCAAHSGSGDSRLGSMGVVAFARLCRDAGLFGFAEFSEKTASEIFNGVSIPGQNAIGWVDFKWALDLAAERVGVSYADLCVTLLELGLGDDDAVAADRDEREVANAEERWRVVEAENREREVSVEMQRQKRLSETRARRLAASGLLHEGLPASPTTPSRQRQPGSNHASPRVSGNAQDVADVNAIGDGVAMKELKSFVSEVGGGPNGVGKPKQTHVRQ